MYALLFLRLFFMTIIDIFEHILVKYAFALLWYPLKSGAAVLYFTQISNGIK